MIKEFLSNRNLLFVTRLALGGLFIYASFDKMIHPLPFAQIVHHYRLMPPYVINIWAVILPWIEAIAGICLILGYRAKGANLILGGLLAMFIAVLAITAARGINVSCGCFSTSIEVKSNLIYRIIEDVGMAILFLHILIFYKPGGKRQVEGNAQPVIAGK
jgi:uncharacterized membrane protein YphA (DoxX/SURF4 family)